MASITFKDLGKVKVGKLLGEGGFGYVYMAKASSSKKSYALKKLNIQSGEQKVEADQLVRSAIIKPFVQRTCFPHRVQVQTDGV